MGGFTYPKFFPLLIRLFSDDSNWDMVLNKQRNIKEDENGLMG